MDYCPRVILLLFLLLLCDNGSVSIDVDGHPLIYDDVVDGPRGDVARGDVAQGPRVCVVMVGRKARVKCFDLPSKTSNHEVSCKPSTRSTPSHKRQEARSLVNPVETV